MIQANDFGELLRRHRETANLSQEGLADLADLDRTFVSLLERGQRQPSLETVFKLCAALKIRPHEFVRQLELLTEASALTADSIVEL